LAVLLTGDWRAALKLVLQNEERKMELSKTYKKKK